MMTFQDMLSRVRRQAKDEDAAVWPDPTVQACILDAVKEIGQRRPESRLDKRGKLRGTPAEWPEDAASPIPLDDFYEEAVAALATSILHLRDALDAKDEALGSFWQRRAAELIGG